MSFNGKEILPESVSNVTDTGSVGLGTWRTVGGVDYVYAYNAGTTSAPAGCWAHALSDTTGYSVDFAGTAKIGIPFGIVRNTTVSAAQYFWLAKRGLVPLRGGTSDNTCVPGRFVIPMASGLFESISGKTATWYDTMRVCPKIVVIVSAETEACALTGWGWVNL